MLFITLLTFFFYNLFACKKKCGNGGLSIVFVCFCFFVCFFTIDRGHLFEYHSVWLRILIEVIWFLLAISITTDCQWTRPIISQIYYRKQQRWIEALGTHRRNCRLHTWPPNTLGLWWSDLWEEKWNKSFYWVPPGWSASGVLESRYVRVSYHCLDSSKRWNCQTQ